MSKAIVSRSNQQGHAVVLVPHGRSVNNNFAERIWKYVTGRHYEFVALVRDWPAAALYLGAGQANVVVMSSDAEATDGETVRIWPTAAEPCPDEPTRENLAAARRRAMGNSRFVSGRLSRERVRELLDGPGDVTGPMGIDPETIAAARRLARRLDERP